MDVNFGDEILLRRRRKKEIINNSKTALVTIAAIIFAVLFLTPIILTITNSFMSAAEIGANYGSIFEKKDKGTNVFISKTVNLKLLPDMVSLTQYYTVLFKSPEYLLKFWNSVIYVVPIVVVQLTVAVLAAYGFSRYYSKLKRAIFV